VTAPSTPTAARFVVRIAAASVSIAIATAGSIGLASASAMAVTVGTRGTPGGHLSPPETLAIFVGIPVGLAALIAFLVCLPSMVKGPRYRPGRPWGAGASWFAAPAGGEVAADAITTLPQATVEGGGASARW
jgi:hypothetical protein